MRKVLFLDFDGVLFDSTKEAYLLARYAYSGISVFDEIEQNDYKLFCKYRYLIANSWQYYHLLNALKSTDIVAEFQKNIKARSQADKQFDLEFQNARKWLIAKHLEFWQELDTPYPFFYEILKLQSKLDIMILSTKNESAINQKLTQHQLKLSPEKIIGKETLIGYKSKGDFLRDYMDNESIERALFVEDSQENLLSCQGITGLDLALAAWGYCDPKAQGKSIREIIQNIEQVFGIPK